MHIWSPGLSYLLHVCQAGRSSESIPGLLFSATWSLHLSTPSSPWPLCWVTLHTFTGPFRTLLLPFSLELSTVLPRGRVTQCHQSLMHPQRPKQVAPNSLPGAGAALSALPHSPAPLPAFLHGNGPSITDPGEPLAGAASRCRRSPAFLFGLCSHWGRAVDAGVVCPWCS